MAVTEVVLTAAATLIATFGTQWFATRAERERRHDEQRLRELDHGHQLRLALQDHRLDAYRVLKSAVREQTQAHDELASRWASRRMLTERMKAASRDEVPGLVQEFDANDEDRRASLATASGADRTVQIALDGVEVVASTPVADAARALSGVVRDLKIARMKWAHTATDEVASIDAWDAVADAELAVLSAGVTLDEAIRRELRLDT